MGVASTRVRVMVAAIGSTGTLKHQIGYQAANCAQRYQNDHP